jgi:CheY-like chemotaxis protein
MSNPFKAFAFDLDQASLASLREALPEWDIEVVSGASAASLHSKWKPQAADLLVVQASADVAETIKLCRFLAFRGIFSTDSREDAAPRPVPRSSRQDQARQADAPLLVLVHSGQEGMVQAALDAGADKCLVLPVHAKEVASMLADVQRGRPGRHTLNLERAQTEDRWRDEGGQG